MGCCSNCDKGLPCADGNGDLNPAVAAGIAGSGMGATAIEMQALLKSRAMSPAQRAMQGHVLIQQMMSGRPIRGFGQAGAVPAKTCCGGGTIIDANGNCVPACVSSVGGAAGSVAASIPSVNGLCPQGFQLAPQGIADYWCQASTTAKVAVVAGGVGVVGLGAWLLMRKKRK
jgi:hypothetical protein